MEAEEFFREQQERSAIKSRIVSKYFDAWFRVVKSWTDEVGYIDLFCGPGRYEDGTMSTPLLILTKAVEAPELSQKLVAIFNDADAYNVEKLRQDISNLAGIENLAHPPQVYNEPVGESCTRHFDRTRTSLSFIDPFGYSGLSLSLIHKAIDGWGSDCIIFFNYNRINRAVSNPGVHQHMQALFGPARAERLRQQVQGMTPAEREAAVLEAITEALEEMGSKHVLPFRFRNELGSRTTHFLLFLSKHFRGYDIMKDVMARESSSADEGVPSFTYCQADERMPRLFSFTRPLSDLEEMLLVDFAGRRIPLEELYRAHSVGKRYLMRNYQDVLTQMETDGKITCNPPATSRPTRNGRRTMALKTIINFPDRHG